MAVAGGMTTAYSMTPGTSTRPKVEHTTRPSDRCTSPAEAVQQLRNWTPDSAPVIVQGSDMAEFWDKWEKANA